jgi:hypothetical protein
VAIQILRPESVFSSSCWTATLNKLCLTCSYSQIYRPLQIYGCKSNDPPSVSTPRGNLKDFI